MKWILTFLTLVTVGLAPCLAQNDKITSLSDSRIPAEVKTKLGSISNPEELAKFKYTSTTREMAKDTPTMTIKTTISFSFSNGQIIGSIVVEKNNIGYNSTQTKTEVELCYMYCCTDAATKKERCTQDYNLYKQWAKHPENCANARTTACKN